VKRDSAVKSEEMIFNSSESIENKDCQMINLWATGVQRRERG
jgi:hypothetical protein